jgi:uncharacterized membrane protein YoaT (DUF817 family)
LAQFADFTRIQAISCTFPVGIFACLAIGKAVPIPGVPRYDVILILCLALQTTFLFKRWETIEEAKASLLFHGCGLGLELFKVRVGSWSYPGDAYSKVLDVPLYSGFMYASVAGYMQQAWRRFDLRLDPWPNPVWAVAVGVGIYVNFFTHHVLWDMRWVLALLTLLVFGRTWVSFRVAGVRRRHPICLSFVLIGFFVWLAESIATGLGAWVYPHQRNGWVWVHPSKFGSWALLVIVTFVVVARQKKPHWDRLSPERLRNAQFAPFGFSRNDAKDATNAKPDIRGEDAKEVRA